MDRNSINIEIWIDPYLYIDALRCTPQPFVLYFLGVHFSGQFPDEKCGFKDFLFAEYFDFVRILLTDNIGSWFQNSPVDRHVIISE